LYRIASVVDAVFNQMKNQPAFASPFNGSETNDDERARLTYFWWMVLGGNKLSDLDSEVIRGRMGISPSLLETGSRCFAKQHFLLLVQS
jgi:hypothetical protein